jgi:hypothetical protein
MAQADSGDLTRTYRQRLDQLKGELEQAALEYDQQSADGAGYSNEAALKLKAEAYEQALSRYRKFLMGGIAASADRESGN